MLVLHREDSTFPQVILWLDQALQFHRRRWEVLLEERLRAYRSMAYRSMPEKREACEHRPLALP